MIKEKTNGGIMKEKDSNSKMTQLKDNRPRVYTHKNFRAVCLEDFGGFYKEDKKIKESTGWFSSKVIGKEYLIVFEDNIPGKSSTWGTVKWNFLNNVKERDRIFDKIRKTELNYISNVIAVDRRKKNSYMKKIYNEKNN